MTSLLLVFLLGFILLALFAGLVQAMLRSSSASVSPQRYETRNTILSPAERSFAGVLDGALPDGVSWFAKVRVGDVVVTRKGLSPNQRASAWNRVNQKHVDFLLFRVSDFAPLAGIELDDRSHEAEDRKTRDAFVDEVFASCKLPLLHIRAQAAYNQADLRASIAEVLLSAEASSSAKSGDR